MSGSDVPEKREITRLCREIAHDPVAYHTAQNAHTGNAKDLWTLTAGGGRRLANFMERAKQEQTKSAVQVPHRHTTGPSFELGPNSRDLISHSGLGEVHRDVNVVVAGCVAQFATVLLRLLLLLLLPLFYYRFLR